MPEIVVDSREARSVVHAALQRDPTVTISTRELPCGDYLPHPSFGVELKVGADFVLSIMDRRLFAQVKRMKDEYEQVLFLLIGDPYASRSGMNPDAIRGALSYLMAIEGVSLMMVQDAREAALLLATLARQLQEGLGYEVSLRANKPKDVSDLAQYLVEGCPGVGPSGAKALLKHFGSPMGVFSASVEELCRAPGVGKKTAERIHMALRASVA